MSYTEILYDVSGRIATITMNRPDRLNAYTGTMGEEMRAAMRAALTAAYAVDVVTFVLAATFLVLGVLPLAYATGVPFGMNHRHQHSWWTFGGGADLINEALKPFKTHAILCGKRFNARSA